MGAIEPGPAQRATGSSMFNGRWTSPGMDVISIYADQFPDGELGRAFAAKYNIPIYKTIAEALCLGATSWRWMPCSQSASTENIRLTPKDSMSIPGNASLM